MCYCTPNIRTPCCSNCPHEEQVKWGFVPQKKVTMKEDDVLRSERTAILIGTILGQTSELLNHMVNQNPSVGYVYSALLDIQKMASMQLHEIYYKGNTR